MDAYPGSYADQIVLQVRIAAWEDAERVHARVPSEASEQARRLAAKRVDQQRALISRRAKQATGNG